VGLKTLPVKKKTVEKPPKNSAGFCGGGQGLNWAVEPRREREKIYNLCWKPFPTGSVFNETQGKSFPTLYSMMNFAKLIAICNSMRCVKPERPHLKRMYSPLEYKISASVFP
jgi:hypothetical protein